MKKVENNLFSKVTAGDRVQMIYDRKLKRIRRKKDSEKIIELEYLYIDYFNKKISLDDLIGQETMKDLIEKIIKAFYTRNRNRSRITLVDFVSAAYEKTWKTIIQYNYKKKYFLYQYLKQAVRCACIDVLRSEGLTKIREGHNNNKFNLATPIDLIIPEDPLQLEETILLKFSIHEFVSQLDPDELKVFTLYLNADNIEKVTLDEICKELGL